MASAIKRSKAKKANESEKSEILGGFENDRA